MVFLPRESFFWMEIRVTGGKGSCIGSIYLRSIPRIRTPLKWRDLGKFAIDNRD